MIQHQKRNESGFSMFRPPLCTYRLTGPGEPPEDGEMIEMSLSSRHRIRNSSPGGQRPSTLPFCDFHTWMGKKHFLFLSNRRDREPNPEWSERIFFSKTKLIPLKNGASEETTNNDFLQEWGEQRSDFFSTLCLHRTRDFQAGKKNWCL